MQRTWTWKRDREVRACSRAGVRGPRVSRLAVRGAGALALGASLLAAPAQALPVAPGHAITQIATPGVATGGVVAHGGALLVGVGSFGATQQAVARIDASGATILADGFNALSGFVYDAVNDRLVVGDNAGELPGAETGDTIYGIASPFTRTGPVLRARDLALLPAGTVPGAADVILDPSDPTGRRFLVTDAFFPFPGPPNGKLWRLDETLASASVLQSGLGYAAGVAALGSTLFVGDVDAFTFAGRIATTALPSAASPLAPFVSGLVGQGDLVVASDGSLLAVASGFGVGSFVLRIDPESGALTTVASGFDYASALAEENGTIYVIDGGFPGFSSVFVLTPVPEPASALALALGCIVLAARARRRAERAR